jgi:hypothetical protein
MLGHITATFSSTESSIKIDDDFFSVAMTIPLDATRREGWLIYSERERSEDVHP